MRDGWIERPLSSLVERSTQKNSKLNDLVFTCSAEFGLVPQEEFFTKRVASKNLSNYWVVEPGAYVYNKSYSASAPLGVITRSTGGRVGVVSPIYFVFRPVDPSLAHGYLDLAVLEATFLAQLREIVKEGGRAHGGINVTLGDFFALRVLLPPLEEQRRIVDVVGSVDTYIDALKDKVAKARTARNAVLHELLSADGPDWTESTLGDVVFLKPGKYIAKDSYVADGKYWIYGSNSVMGRYSDALVHEPHVVMAAIGAYAGAVRHSEDPSWVNNNAFALIPKSQLLSTWLYYWLGSSLEISSVVVGTGQPYVQRPALMNQVLNLPPIEEQRRIAGVVSSMDEVIAASEKAVAEAVRLRSGLLSDLLSGEHEIPVSYDSLLGAA